MTGVQTCALPISNEKYGKRIGIMGGTFDPIHYGHLMLAEQIRTGFFLDEIVFIPVGRAPHKALSDTADKFQRYEMTQRAISSNPHFSVSDIEINKEGITYTVDTIKEIKASLNSNDALYFITGADALLLLESWKDYSELIKMVYFIGATRPGINNDSLAKKINHLETTYDVQIELSYVPALAISSTDIRHRIEQEKSIRYLLPESVEQYISDHFLYKNHYDGFEKMNTYLKNTLSSKRYTHSVGTANTARKLALKYNSDPTKAEFAGLCHDLAKELKKEKMLKYIDIFSIFKDPCIEKQPNLAHGEVAAALLELEFGILDEEILNAVKWHTYGCENMSLLSKIVYMADIIEPSRDFESVDELRRLAFINLDDAILSFNDNCEIYMKQSGQIKHTYTDKMLASIRNEANNTRY